MAGYRTASEGHTGQHGCIVEGWKIIIYDKYSHESKSVGYQTRDI